MYYVNIYVRKHPGRNDPVRLADWANLLVAARHVVHYLGGILSKLLFHGIRPGECHQNFRVSFRSVFYARLKYGII